MIRAYAGAQTAAAIGQNNILNIGVPSDEEWTLLEIRVPVSAMALTHIRIFLNDVEQYDLIPTIDNHEFVIGDKLVGPIDIRCVVDKLDAIAQIQGITIVVDQPLQP